MRVHDYFQRAKQQSTGGKITGTEWINVNKGDFDNPRVRCSSVGKEFKTGPDDGLYASTPPLEASRLILGRPATVDDGGGGKREIMVNHVSRAHVYAKMTRPLYRDSQ